MDLQGQKAEEEVAKAGEEVGSSFRQDIRDEEEDCSFGGQGASGFSIGLDCKLTGFLGKNSGGIHQYPGGSVVYLQRVFLVVSGIEE